MRLSDRIAECIDNLNSRRRGWIGVGSACRQMKVLELPPRAEIGRVVIGLHAWVSQHEISFQLCRGSRVTLDGDRIRSEPSHDVARLLRVSGVRADDEEQERGGSDLG